MKDKILELFFYPHSKQWSIDYNNGVDTLKKSLISAVLTGLFLSLICVLLIIIWRVSICAC